MDERETSENLAGPVDEDEDEEELDPEQIERDLTAFIASAESLAGPPVTDLADYVASRMRVAWSEIEAVMADVAHNKLLATMLLTSQRARQVTPDDPEQWRLHAAGSLLSGMVGLRAAEFRVPIPEDPAD